jgi:hypothetical protein
VLSLLLAVTAALLLLAVLAPIAALLLYCWRRLTAPTFHLSTVPFFQQRPFFSSFNDAFFRAPTMLFNS